MTGTNSLADDRTRLEAELDVLAFERQQVVKRIFALADEPGDGRPFSRRRRTLPQQRLLLLLNRRIAACRDRLGGLGSQAAPPRGLSDRLRSRAPQRPDADPSVGYARCLRSLSGSRHGFA